MRIKASLSILLSAMLLQGTAAMGQNLSRISKSQGLSNSFVLSLCQDTQGLIWIGTMDGVHVLYNNETHAINHGKLQTLKNTPVNEIVDTKTGGMWIQTMYGLLRLNTYTNEVTAYDQFDGNYLVRGSRGYEDIVVLDKNYNLLIYRRDSDTFENLHLPVRPGRGILNIGFNESYLWTAGTNGITRYPWIGEKQALGKGELIDPTPITFCGVTRGGFYTVDREGILSLYELANSSKTSIVDLSEEIQKRGGVTAVVNFDDKLFVSFNQKGVLRFTFDGGKAEKMDFGINVGVLAMNRDRTQDILWIATNGEGLYKYWEGEYQIRNFKTVDIHPDFTNPVSAVLSDSERYLWIGTMGSGLMVLKRNENDSYGYSLRNVYREQQYPLIGNHINCMTEGKSLKGIWIGSDKGLSFFDKSVSSFIQINSDINLQDVSSIVETPGNRLVIGTSGYGVFEAGFKKEGGDIVLTEIQSYNFEGGDISSNMFTGSLPDPTSGAIWLGNRKMGAFKLDESGMRQQTGINNQLGDNQSRNVLSLCLTGGWLWIGTGRGVIARDSNGAPIVFNVSSGIANETIHTLIPDGKGGVWASTNDGIFHIDNKPAVSAYWGKQEGLEITEFCDGASSTRDSTLIFGGVGGWVEMTPTGKKYEQNFIPPFYFCEFHFAGESSYVYVWNEDQRNKIVLPNHTSSFGVTFGAFDNLSNYAVRYKYSLSKDGKDEGWVDNGSSPDVYFNYLKHGKYTLKAKCYYIFSDVESEVQTLDITIQPAWYETVLFKSLIILLILGMIAAIIIFLRMSMREKQEAEMNELKIQHEEKLYKEKLQFFSNITHEFFTPLTLIFGPTERLMEYEGSDSYIHKYLNIIKDNTKRLNLLLKELIQFSKLERNQIKVVIRNGDIASMTAGILPAFEDIAEKAEIKIEKDMPDSLVWNTDPDAYVSILSNLLSNAVKYTPKGGTIRLSLSSTEEILTLKVFNTGKGISKQHQDSIFDNYKILDQIEEKASKGIMTQNGLGLAICKSTCTLLGGNISLNSVEGEWAEFVVNLPKRELDEQYDDIEAQESNPVSDAADSIALISEKDQDNDAVSNIVEGKPVILVIDDNKDILFLLKESLSQYNVMTCDNAADGIELFKKGGIDLVVTDIMMDEMDGIALTKIIKGNKHTMEIPIVIISAKGSSEDKIEGYKAGCDVYIEKPFDINYLSTVIGRLLNKGIEAKEYYNTSASAFSFIEGKLAKKEDVEFVTAVNDYIQKNIQDKITISDMANALNISSRSLYRKFSDIGFPSPNEYVNTFKLKYSAKLLRTTSMAVKEIMYSCGYTNKAHFHRKFQEHFGMTPGAYRSENRIKDNSLD